MTRAGVGYVAMAAAAICAGTLGYAVIWSYGEPERLPAAMSAPAAPPVAIASKPIQDGLAPPGQESELPAGSAPSSDTATQPRTGISPAPVAEGSPTASVEAPAAATSGAQAAVSALTPSPPLPTEAPITQIAPALPDLPRTAEAML